MIELVRIESFWRDNPAERKRDHRDRIILAVLSARKLGTGWLYCLCPPDERAMRYLYRGPTRSPQKAPQSL